MKSDFSVLVLSLSLLLGWSAGAAMAQEEQIITSAPECSGSALVEDSATFFEAGLGVPAPLQLIGDPVCPKGTIQVIKLCGPPCGQLGPLCCPYGSVVLWDCRTCAMSCSS